MKKKKTKKLSEEYGELAASQIIIVCVCARARCAHACIAVRRCQRVNGSHHTPAGQATTVEGLHRRNPPGQRPTKLVPIDVADRAWPHIQTQVRTHTHARAHAHAQAHAHAHARTHEYDINLTAASMAQCQS